MEALAISAANLNIIEDNLGAVAKELNGVLENFNHMTDHVTDVEEQVASLNNEVKSMMEEIRENTIITNARQAIMYNNQIIEKQFGYHDNVRRITISLIDAIKYSHISTNSLIKLREDLLLNNPNYWLTNALSSLISWFLDDKEETYLELNNALRQNPEQTSIFFTLVNLKLDRIDTSINWLNYYLSLQDPTNLSKDFVSILDLVATGTFGDNQKITVLNKIKEWMTLLNTNTTLEDKQLTTWTNYILDHQYNSTSFFYANTFITNKEVLNNNLNITSTYKGVFNSLNNILTTPSNNKKIDDILKNIIYEYDSQEQIYHSDNLLNELIIKCNGNRDKATKLYDKQKDIYNENLDILSLLTNIAIYPDNYKISKETQKISLALIKKYIIKSYNNINALIKNDHLNIVLDDFNTNTLDGSDYNEAINKLDIYLNNRFVPNDKDLILLLSIIDIVGLIIVFLTLNYRLINILLIIILLISNIYIFKNILNRQKARNEERDRVKENYTVLLERIYAEIVDYNTIKNNNLEYQNKLMTFLNNLDENSYINNNNERNIMM